MSYPQNNLKKKIKLQKNFSQSANIKSANILDQELNRETDLLHMPKIQKAKTETTPRPPDYNGGLNLKISQNFVGTKIFFAFVGG